MKINTNIFRIETNHIAPQQGNILIAEPFLSGSYFNRSIIILATCNKDGAVGFILNKKVDFPVFLLIFLILIQKFILEDRLVPIPFILSIPLEI
jgi:putative transcriptional regulator